METIEFKRGDHVVWTYWHTIYPGRPFQRRKRGVFLRLIRHRASYWRKPGSEQLAWVAFDGNYNASRVPVCRLCQRRPDR